MENMPHQQGYSDATIGEICGPESHGFTGANRTAYWGGYAIGCNDLWERNRAASEKVAEMHRDVIALDKAVTTEREALQGSIEALTADVGRLEAELTEARESLAEWHNRALEYHTQRDEHAKRADVAERQLAEYRSLMAALPAGAALAYPAALSLLKAYLADKESEVTSN